MRDKKIFWLSVFRNVVPADYEKWLESLALEGWNVDRIGQWSSIAMTFYKTKPKKYRYIFDIQVIHQKDYASTYEQFGWELVGQMASCFIWRKEYEDVRPESFTDPQSLEKRNKQVVAAVSVSFTIFSLTAIALIVLFAIYFDRLNMEQIIQFILGMGLSSTFAIYLGHVMHKIYLNRMK